MLNEKVSHCRQSCLLGHVCFLALINVCILFPDLFPQIAVTKEYSAKYGYNYTLHIKADLESEVAKWL